MATKEFPLEPETVDPIETTYRRIQTQLPVPESLSILKEMRTHEPRSMGGQPPIVWDHGEGATVSDRWGNRWLDFSSGVLVTSSGHGRREIVDAIVGMAQQGLYHAYCFPTEIRSKLVEALANFAPAELNSVFLLTTGSEATECCIKLARTYGMQEGGPKKRVLVSFSNGFHGRTMGAQLAGGVPGLKAWLGEPHPDFVQVPFPDGFRQQDTSFELFEKTLAEAGVDPNTVCGVMGETFQGCNATLMPTDYAQALRRWCDKHRAVMIFDEVQAAFGRSGKAFSFQHLSITPDLVACGKGISGGMPLSAVIGRDEIMNLYGPGEMTSTHSANPICSAAALANLEVIKNEGLVENAAKLQSVLLEGVKAIVAASNGRIGHADGVGLVTALQFTQPGTTEPDPDTAWKVVYAAYKRGLLLFAPVGVGGGAIKICPPLVIDEAALQEGLDVLKDVVSDVTTA